MSKHSSLFEEMGGEAVINQVVRRFYEAVFADPMIGFFFFASDKENLIRSQIQFVSSLLDGPGKYEGKPLIHAHKPFPIRRAHFNRRQTILRETLKAEGVADALAAQWLAREEKLRSLVLSKQQKG